MPPSPFPMHPDDPINYTVADRDLKYYIFDWDDNILHMPTRIHLERRTRGGEWVPHEVSTAAFSVIRNDPENYRPPDGDWDKAFAYFRDIRVGDENVFLRDTRHAVDRVVSGKAPGGPSFERFRKVLIEGRLFAIVTARGHSPEIIREGVRYFLQRVLSPDRKREMLRNLRGYLECFQPGHGLRTDGDVLENYLGLNKYHGVMSPHFQQLMGTPRGSGPGSESGKQFAIRDFVDHVLRIAGERGLAKPISVGFSDDDERNVEAIERYIREELARQHPGVKFVVYYTADPAWPSARKVVVSGQLTLDFGSSSAPGGSGGHA